MILKQRQTEKIDHRSYTEQGNGLQPTIHEGTWVTQLRRKGIDTEISRYNDDIKQNNAKYSYQLKQRTESVLEAGLSRVDQGFEQWKQKQEAKRLELELKERLRLEKQQAEEKLKRSSPKLDKGGLSL